MFVFWERVHRSSSSGRRVLYTYNEDKTIINYISANNRFSQISGNVVWKQLEMSKVRCLILHYL